MHQQLTRARASTKLTVSSPIFNASRKANRKPLEEYVYPTLSSQNQQDRQSAALLTKEQLYAILLQRPASK